MTWIRRHPVKAAVLWTGLMVVCAVLLAAQAAWSLFNGQQACFFGGPNVPCPGIDDPAVARLFIAFVGVPLIWWLGIFAAALVVRRRDQRR
jgi:hypothetical protein